MGPSKNLVTWSVAKFLLEKGEWGKSERGVCVEMGGWQFFYFFSNRKVVKMLIFSESENTDYFNFSFSWCKLCILCCVMYIKSKRFISPRVLFWFVPSLRRLVLKDSKYSKILSLRRFGRNQNVTLGEINVYVCIYMYKI